MSFALRYASTDPKCSTYVCIVICNRNSLNLPVY